MIIRKSLQEVVLLVPWYTYFVQGTQCKIPFYGIWKEDVWRGSSPGLEPCKCLSNKHRNRKITTMMKMAVAQVKTNKRSLEQSQCIQHKMAVMSNDFPATQSKRAKFLILANHIRLLKLKSSILALWKGKRFELPLSRNMQFSLENRLPYLRKNRNIHDLMHWFLLIFSVL